MVEQQNTDQIGNWCTPTSVSQYTSLGERKIVSCSGGPAISVLSVCSLLGLYVVFIRNCVMSYFSCGEKVGNFLKELSGEKKKKSK